MNDILKNIKLGETIIEMKDVKYQTLDGNVYDVIDVVIYSKVKKRKLLKTHEELETNHIPFCFESKEFANEFLQQYDKFDIEKGIYKEISKKPGERVRECYSIKIKKSKNSYMMIDSLKLKEHGYHGADTCQLEPGGVWGGMINTMSSTYYTFDKYYKNYKQIFNLEPVTGIIAEGDKHYYKLEKIENYE